MKLKFSLFIVFLFAFALVQAQEYVFGKITNESNSEIQDVTVLNVRTDERTATNRDGHFMILARLGDELRFVYSGYQRKSVRVSQENFKTAINIVLPKEEIAIEEVTIAKRLTGDLKIDSKTFGKSTKVKKLEADLNQYMKMKSDPRVLAARPGEFVQPAVRGISIGKIKNKWDDVDCMQNLIAALGESYFTDLQLTKQQIQPFIYFVFRRGFERSKILKYGYISPQDLSRFQTAVLNNISIYQSPDEPKKK